MLAFNLRPIFKARGIERPYSFLVKAGFSSHAANTVLNSEARVLRLDHIERLCRILVCDPNDLIVYIPQNDQPITEEHPLNNLKQTEPFKAIKETLATIPYKQLKDLTKQINTQP